MATPGNLPDPSDVPLPSAFATVAANSLDLDAFEQMMKALPSGTGDLDKLFEEEMKNASGKAARANSLDIFRRMHSLRAMSLMNKALKPETASGDSGNTDTNALDLLNTRSPRKKRGRMPIVSRDTSFCNSPGEGPEDKVLKKERRMLSNRESARRSRRRKQEMMLDLENQVARLTEENAVLKQRIRELESK
jgi:hypothetical protein